MARKKLLTEGEIRQFMKLANLRPISKVRLSEMGGHSYPGARDEEDDLEDLEGEEMAMDDEEMDLDDEEMDMDMDMDAGGAGGDMVSMDDFMSALERAIEEVTGEEADVSEEPGDEEMEMDMEMGPEGDEMEMDVEEEPMMEVDRGRRGHGGGARSTDPEKNKRGKFGGNKGDIPDADRKKKGHYGRGGKTKETAEEEGEVDFKEGMADAAPAPHRSPRMQRKRPEEDDGPVGDIMTGDDSEMLSATEYDPSEEIPRSKRGAKGRYRRDESMDDIVNEVAKRVAMRLQKENRKEQMVDQLAERIMKRLTK